MSFLDRSDLQRILGWHDGAGIHLTSQALNSPAVMSHEAIHGRLFNETPDGNLHRACCLAANTPYDQVHGGVYARAARFLFDDTRIAHEAAATYLGILGLPSAEVRSAELAKLPPDYRAYYDKLAKFADPISRTSWLRHAFAWTLCHWCFNSLRAIAFFGSEAPDFEAIRRIPSPSQRMDEAISLLSGTTLTRWRDETLDGAAALAKGKGIELWDLEDEAAWDRRGRSTATRQFDNYLTHTAGHWLLDNLDIATQDYRNPDPLLGPGFGKLMGALGRRVTSVYRGAETELDPALRPFLLRRTALERGADSIQHSPWSRATDLSGDGPDRLLELTGACLPTATDLFFLSDIRPGQERMLVLFRARRASSVPDVHPFQFDEVGAYLVPIDWAIRLAQAIVDIKEGGGLAQLQLWTLLSASSGSMEQAMLQSLWFSRQLRSVSEDQPIPPPAPPGVRVMLYWHDNWAFVSDIPGAEVGSFSVGFADTGAVAAAKPLSIRVARNERAPFAYILAAKNPWAGAGLEEYEQHRIAEGTLRALAFDDDEAALDEIFTPLIVAWSVWDRF